MESDVVTLQDIFVAKPPDEDHGRAGSAVKLLSPLECTGSSRTSWRSSPRTASSLPADFFDRDDGATAPTFAAAGYGGFA